MAKLDDALSILKAVGMPDSQTAPICRYSLLGLANVGEADPWASATNEWIRIHDIIEFAGGKYGMRYAENSRETFRKQAMHHFRNAAIIEDNGKATNSPNYRYRLTEEFLSLIRTYGSSSWASNLKTYMAGHSSLVEIYESKRRMTKLSINIGGEDLEFSSGKHNELQLAIIEEFAPRFAPDFEVLYVGDTIKKDLVYKREAMKKLGFGISVHDKMPDVVLYCAEKDWLYFIEAVTSVGPMNPSRIIEINEMTKDVKSGKIFVTAFPDIATFKKFAAELAWETEAWISEQPDHMIHFNGDKFIGPR